MHGAGVDDPLVWYEGASVGANRRYLHADHQGSVIAVADSGGTLQTINSYSDWGIANATNQGRFQYTGQIIIPEIGFYHYKARIYSPTLGRFLQTDPVGYEDQVNLYAYVGNDPVNNIDPSGNYTCGADLKGKQCENFQKRQAETASRIAGGISALKSISDTIKSGGELTDTQKAWQQGIEKFGGEGMGSSTAFIDKVISIGKGVLSALASDMPAQLGSKHGTALAAAPPGHLVLRPTYFEASNMHQRLILAHEASHHAGLPADSSVYSNGSQIGAYGIASALMRAAQRPDTSLRNPDNIVHIFGFRK